MSISQFEIEKTLEKTVLLYNRLKAPQIFAKIILINKELIAVSFSGIFCFSCGVLNYIEDFTNSFKALTGKAELKISDIKEINPHSFEVYFEIKEK